MVKLIYGVSGEGSGHSTRARIVASHLLERGHDVVLASYDRGYRNLKDHFEVVEIEGLTIGSENNKVSLLKTIQQNLGRLPDANRRLTALRTQFKSMRPQVVLSDFEPMTAYLAHHYGLPLVSIDNQHRMRYVQAPIPPGLEREARLTRAIVRAMVPKPDVALVTTFVQGAPKHDRVFQFAPMVDPQVARLQPRPATIDSPVLVYLTSGFDELLKCLPQFARERFRIYGCGTDQPAAPNIQFLPPSRDGFLSDLRDCRAIIATAGFTLISEALHLGKPYLAYPMQGQYEQQLNAIQLDDAGLGRWGRSVARNELAAFFYDLPDFDAALGRYNRGDNSELLAKLDELLDDEAALAREYRRRRKGKVFWP